MPVKVWIQAARLRTLPLAIAGTVTGNLLAYAEHGTLNPLIMLLSILTAIFLQVLSNYANDYGDFRNGADTAERTDRVMASGMLTEQKMRSALIVLIVLCLITGISLLAVSIHALDRSFWILLGMGIAGLFAAYFYTAGKNPYGYIGLGDFSVFIFFGLLSVAGTYYLQVQNLDSPVWWISGAIGLLSIGVLNVNNIRDIASDKSMNKMTIPVRIGYKNAIYYQVTLLSAAIACFMVYGMSRQNPALGMILNTLIFTSFVFLHIRALREARERVQYNSQLKFLSLTTFILSLYFCMLQILMLP